MHEFKSTASALIQTPAAELEVRSFHAFFVLCQNLLSILQSLQLRHQHVLVLDPGLLCCCLLMRPKAHNPKQRGHNANQRHTRKSVFWLMCKSGINFPQSVYDLAGVVSVCCGSAGRAGPPLITDLSTCHSVLEKHTESQLFPAVWASAFPSSYTQMSQSIMNYDLIHCCSYVCCKGNSSSQGLDSIKPVV